ncbi:MAG: ABC transporter ATP-binding protein [Thermogutta sp.]
MSDIAIRVEKLSKKFVLGERVGIKTFRETLQDVFTAPFRRWVRGNGTHNAEKVDTDREIWALKDVSFEVKHGEVLGIIGPNGAGKSTLLKILSRITEPTAGYAEIRGRVGSLLEVGTGFHPELTGRENVYLNGAILGMSRVEIRQKFDDIVSFAGVEKFIDTPVKRYSSGMQVRLAFAVAAHLDPEILIVDEVLAVGDAEFQKRCLGKMDEVAHSGRTVLFVSHNMAAVEGLCTTAMLLDSGRALVLGSPDRVISQYVRKLSFINGKYENINGHDSDRPFFRSVQILTSSRDNTHTSVRCGDPLVLEIAICCRRPVSRARIAVRFFNSRGERVLTCHSAYQYPRSLSITSDTSVLCRISSCRLVPGTYSIEMQLDDGSTIFDRVPRALSLEIIPSDLYGTGKLLPSHATVWLPEVTWEII